MHVKVSDFQVVVETLFCLRGLVSRFEGMRKPRDGGPALSSVSSRSCCEVLLERGSVRGVWTGAT